MIKEFLHPFAFFGEKARGRFILLWILQVDGHMGGIEIPGEDDVLPRSMERIAYIQQAGIEIQLIVHTILPALTIRKIDVIEQKIRVAGADDTTLIVKPRVG